MTKMDNACSVQADLCDRLGTGSYYTLGALNAGNQAMELLSDLYYGSVKNSEYLNEKIESLLEEWN